jgi:5-hydroxyisourate hydrolase
LLQGDELTAGVYELVFAVGPYFADLESTATDINDTVRFLDDVVIRFGVWSPSEHYHVPLLISPYGYSTYRGS